MTIRIIDQAHRDYGNVYDDTRETTNSSFIEYRDGGAWRRAHQSQFVYVDDEQLDEPLNVELDVDAERYADEARASVAARRAPPVVRNVAPVADTAQQYTASEIAAVYREHVGLPFDLPDHVVGIALRAYARGDVDALFSADSADVELLLD